MSGFNNSNSDWTGISPNPRGVLNPTRKATANSPPRSGTRADIWTGTV